MTALPSATDFTGASITEGQFKTAITSLRSFLSELLGTSGTDRVAALTALGAILGDSLNKTGAYTVVAADKGKVINCTGSGGWSLSLTAAATLGDGFAFAVWNNGAGTITIDPNASELIDGATTKTLAAGKMVIIYCDGYKFALAGSADGGNADLLDGNHASAFAGANSNYSFEVKNASYTTPTIGSLVPNGATFNLYSNYGAGTYVIRKTAGGYLTDGTVYPFTHATAASLAPVLCGSGTFSAYTKVGDAWLVEVTANNTTLIFGNSSSATGGTGTFEFSKLKKDA